MKYGYILQRSDKKKTLNIPVFQTLLPGIFPRLCSFCFKTFMSCPGIEEIKKLVRWRGKRI